MTDQEKQLSQLQSQLWMCGVERFELGQRLRNAESILTNLGYTRCNAPACNCNSYHQTEPTKSLTSAQIKPLAEKIREALARANSYEDPLDAVCDAVNILKYLGL